MKIIGVILLSVLCGFLHGCSSNDERKSQLYDNWFGSEIKFPHSDSMVGLDSILDSDGYRVVHYVNADCPKCVYGLADWKGFLENCEGAKKIPFLFIIYTRDQDVAEQILEEIRFDYPVIFDRNNLYAKINKIPEDPEFSTFLLNRQNRIQLIGNPTLNDPIRELYLLKINGVEMTN